ncbi:hypothetical protein PIB30_100075 [Stylosanthes scabra]|uniref:F-box protein n=1 Tax=Stylosanthes scabra TaxID=79078 RepID=A0ABU6QX04_9FABA|nr:hypothetical protein [Stylosanthes scabra]
MADPLLCLVTTKKVFGMQVWNLRKVISDWIELPLLQIEFESEVPHPPQDEIPDLKGVFMIAKDKEAKIYLAGVTSESELSSPWDWNVCNKTYVFDVERKEIMVTGSIVEPPSVMVESFIACIDGDTYFLKCSGKTSELGFWVLKNAEDWEPLSLPFDVFDLDLLAKALSFVNLDRIYLLVSINRKTKVFFFDTKKKTWKEEGAKIVMDSFNHPDFGYCLPTCSVYVKGLELVNPASDFSEFVRWESSHF